MLHNLTGVTINFSHLNISVANNIDIKSIYVDMQIGTKLMVCLSHFLGPYSIQDADLRQLAHPCILLWSAMFKSEDVFSNRRVLGNMFVVSGWLGTCT